MKNRGKHGQIIDTATQRCEARRLSHGGNEVASRLARLKEEDLAKAAGSHTTWVVCDVFHSEVFLDISKESRGEVVEFLAKVEQRGRWPERGCTTMFFSDSEEHHERAPHRASSH